MKKVLEPPTSGVHSPYTGTILYKTDNCKNFPPEKKQGRQPVFCSTGIEQRTAARPKEEQSLSMVKRFGPDIGR